MDKKLDINDLVLFLTGIAMEPVLNNGIWQNYGYKKRPRKGGIWYTLFPNKFQLETLITKEILTMGIIDVLNGIKKSNKSSDTKLLISLGLIDQFLSTLKNRFDHNSFMENLFSVYGDSLECDKSKRHEPFILNAKGTLSNKDFAKFLVGTTAMLGLPPYRDGFLLDSDYIKDAVDNSSKESKLQIAMSEELCKEYGALLSERILNT